MSQDLAYALLSAMPDVRAVRPVRARAELRYFANPEGRLKRGAYFATIKTADGENDRASNLHREGVWGRNFGLPKGYFAPLFGAPHKGPAKGQAITGPWDFQALSTLTPHPVYGWMGWVAIHSPDAAKLDELRPMIALAYGKALAAAMLRLAKEAA